VWGEGLNKAKKGKTTAMKGDPKKRVQITTGEGQCQGGTKGEKKGGEIMRKE